MDLSLAKMLRLAMTYNEKLTREGDTLNFEIAITNGGTNIHCGGEELLTKWIMKTLIDGGLEDKIKKLGEIWGNKELYLHLY